MSGSPADVAIVAMLNRFADEVNAGDIAGALAHFTDSPSIVEDIAPYHWRGEGAGGAWLAAMGENAQRAGFTRIEMRFSEPAGIEVTGPRAYVVLPGGLTFTLVDGSVRRDLGHATFCVENVRGSWRIETLTWAREREAV